MRSFAPTQQHPAANDKRTEAAAPVSRHRAHASQHLQRTVGNQAVQRLLQPNAEASKAHPVSGAATRTADGVNSVAAIARNDSAEELQAHAVGERVRHAPTDAPPLIANDASPAGKTLSDSGRRYFEPLVGPAIDRARLHVDSRAERLTHLAGAKALTYGNDVFIPQDRFAPESVEGRALLGHELAHVAQWQPGRAQLFRQPTDEPRYPTKTEQQEIEKLLSRHFEETKDTAATPPTADGTPAAPPKPPERKELTATEVVDYTNLLKTPYLAELDKLDTGPAVASGDVLGEEDAFGVVTRAREAIYKRYGDYASRNVTLTRDKKSTVADRQAANQVLINFAAVSEHTISLARTLIDTCIDCRTKLAGVVDKSKNAVVIALMGVAMRERGEQLSRVARDRVSGSHSKEQAKINLTLNTETRLYGTAVHELIHALAHPVFHAAFIDERNIIEGFTEYFTRQIVPERGSYPEPFEKISGVHGAIKSPFPFGAGGSSEESLRQAYFRGRLEYIGWKASGPDEQKAVEEAGGSAQWDADTARHYAETYQAQAVAKQAPHRNVLGIGFYFTKGSDDTAIAVRYARVIARTEPYARGQLLVEGQLLGGPVQNPSRLGASLGIAAEYQEPYFYAQGGVRFVGTAAPGSGSNRLDVSPFVGLGIRAWQTVRVGVEGFGAVPILEGQDKLWGGVVNLGFEFK